MKRPEGFDRAAAERAKPEKIPVAPTPRRTRGKTAKPKPLPKRALREVPLRDASVRSSARERRRFERQEVRRFTRRSRHRRLAWVVALGIVALLAGLLAIAVYSPLLSLRTITVDGVSKVNADDVRAAVEDQIGTPLALLDYDALRSNLDAFSLIRSFSTEIVPPSTLKIHIVERAPVGVIASSSGFAVVDPAGVVLESAQRRPDGIPLIDIAGEDTDSVAFTAVVDVILALPESIRSRVDLASATSKDDVRLVLTDAGQRVRWGSSERSALKARVLEELMATQGSTADVEFDVSAPMSPVVRVG